MDWEKYQGLSEASLRLMLRESRSFPERRRLRAILKNFASDPKPAIEGDPVAVCNGVNVKTSLFWTPKTYRLVRDYDRRKTITICLGAFHEATTDDSAIRSRPTPPCWPLVRCKSYTSTLHIHLPEVSASSEFLSSRVSSIDKMAATAGQSRPLATNSDLPSSLDLRRSSSGFGSYRVIRRSSQMLSDNGPLVPTSGSTSHGSASSPLLQIAGDISGSLLTLKRNSTRKTPTDILSATLDTNNTHAKRSTANQEISSSSSFTNSSTNVLRETAEPDDISMSSSHSSVQDSSDVSRLKDNSVQQTSTDSANIGKSDARGDDSRESLICMPLSHSPSRRDSSSVSSDSLERRRKSKMFSELIEVGRQLLSESGDFLADGSYVVTLQNLDSAPRHQNQQNNQLSANIITEKDRTRYLSEANQQETDQSLPEQRTKSRFLSSLYSGQEKIQSFINKGRNQLKAHELSMRLNPRAGQPTGHLDSLAKEGLRNISNEKPYLSDGGDKQGIDSDEMSQRVSPITPGVPVSADGAHKTGPIGGKSSSREEDNLIHKSLPTADVTSTSEHWTNRAESVAQLNSRLRDRLESNQTTKLSVDTLGRRLSSSSDDVFTTGSSSDTRLWSFNSSSGDSKPFLNFEFSDLSHLKRAQSLSPASTASSSRCGTLTLSGSKTSALPELVHISDRRRFSLPDVMEVKAKVQGALKTAADIHHKYSSGRLGPLDRAPRPRSGSQHFKSDKPLTVSHPSPRTTKPKDASTVSHNVATTKNTSKSHVLTKDKHGELLVTELTNEELPSSKAKTSVLDKTDVNVATSLDGKRSTPKRAGSDVVDYKGTQRASFPVTSPTSATSKGLKERPATTGQLEQSHVDYKRQDKMKDIDRSLSLRRGSEKGTSKLVSGQLGRRASEYSPVIGGRSGPKISPALSAVSYKGITSLTELQNLLTHTEDSIERNNIRNVIRHLRQLPESEQLKKGKPGLEKNSAGVGHAREPAADVKRSASTFLPSTSSPTRTQSLRTSGSRSSNGLKFDNGSSHEQAPSPSRAPVSSFSLNTNSPSSSVKASQSSPRQNNNNSAKPKPTVRQSLAAKSDHSESREDKTYNDNLDGSKASDVSKVSQKTDSGAESSSVLEQVKAKLESRRNSSNNELKTPDHLRSTLTKSLATPLETPSSDDVFSFPESKKTQCTFQDQNLRRGSTGGDRYREARHHILKLSGLTYGQKPSLTTDHLSPTAEVKADIESSVQEPKSPHEIKTLTNEKSIKNSDSTLSTHSSKGQSKQCDDLDAESKTSPQIIIPKAVGSVTDKKEPLHKQIPPDELLNLSDSSGKPVSQGVKDDERKTGQLSHVTNEEQKKTPKTSTISTPKPGAVQETPVKRTRSLYTPGKSSLDSRNKNVDLTDMSTFESVLITARAICEKPKQSDSDTSGETVMPVLNLVSNNRNDHLDSVKLDSVLNTTQKMEPILHTVGVTIASETVELPSKPTLTRSRPVGRSLTESRMSRPEIYRDDRFLARIDENAELHKDNSVEMHYREPQQEILQPHEPQQEIPQPATRQRKVGVIMTGAPPVMESKPDITEGCQVARHPGYGLRLAPQESEGSHLNSLLRDFQLQKPVDEESLVARMKRFSAPAPNYVQMQVASSHLDDQSKRRHSEIYNKQEAIKIEQAFSSLLEDLEVVSGSESNISDHEHSESDDSLASSHGSSASLDSSYQTLKTLGNKELPTSLPSKSEEQNNEPLTSYQHHDLTSTHHTDITTSDKVKDYHKDGLSSMSQEDSGIALSPEELPQKQDNVDRSNLAEESQPAAISASSASQETCTDLTDGAIMTGERLDQSEPHSAMEMISSHSSTTTAVLQLAPTPQISQETIGTRTFRVNQDKDGGITLQASAEDENQNRVVTVRTLKQRTPSDADEELRDKIVQKKMVSPGGTVLEEKAVVQTKKKLTSRGSNYYTRSTYTTRTKRDKHGQETVEHNVSVETENKSVSQGQSWGNKVVTSVTLDEGGNPVLSENENDRKTEAKLAITNKADGGGEVSGIAPSLTAVSPTEMIKAITSVKVEGPPEITQPLTDVTSLEGKHVTLSCGIRSTQTTHVTWYKNDVEITEADLYACHYDEEEGRATLRIPDATIFDTACYSAICQNSLGEARTTCSVVIKRRYENVPAITKGLSDLSVGEGHSVHLVCSILDAASTAWFKNGKLLVPSVDVQQVYDGKEASLNFNEVLLEDAGCYECVATNDCGESSTSCTLVVTSSGSENTVVPVFLTKFSDTQILDGENVTLECEVIGSPEPNITWWKNGHELPAYLSFSANYDGRVSCLQINNMKSEDSGIYKCTAENTAGKVSREANVTVLVKRAPHFVSKLEDVNTSRGKTVVLRCSVAGTPQPSVSWKKDGISIGQSYKYLQSYHNGVARLEILQAVKEDSGNYECVAGNVVTETSCVSRVVVLDPEAQRSTQAPIDDHVIETLPKVTRTRTFKKLSEPRPSDIITAVIQRASSMELQRTQSLDPSSMVQTELSANVVNQNDQKVNSYVSSSTPALASEISVVPRPASLGQLSKPAVSSRSLTSLEIQPKADQTSPLPQLAKGTTLGRSVSMHVVRNNNLLSPDNPPLTTKVTWSPSRDHSEMRETINKATSLEIINESKPLNSIPGYRPVSPVFLTSPDKEKPSVSPLARNDITGGSLGHDPVSKDIPKIPKSELENHSSSKLITSLTATSQSNPPHEISLKKLGPSSTSPSHPVTTSSTENDQPAKQEVKALPRVSQLRLQFLQNDLQAQQSRPLASSGAGIKRWHSLPPQDVRPNVVKRDKTALPTPSVAMPSYDEINDEEELHKLMNSTEDFEERKKIRSRLREIRDKQRDELEAKRKQREAEAEDLVKKKFEKAEEEKKKKMEAYKQQAPTHQRDSKYHEVTQNLIADKYKAAEEEKAKKLAAYTHIAETTGPGGDKTVSKTTTTSSTENTPGGGIRTTTTTTKIESSSKGFGGTSYSKPAEVTAQELAQRLMGASGPGVSGRITVKTESWNSSDGRVEKSEKSQSWGAKPQNAMAAFKQMDNANAPAGGAKANALVSVSLAKKAASSMKKNIITIKQELMSFCQANTEEYEGVEITNFSSSWNNGLAFCALIHHFFPNAFDFNSLEASKRRYNFTLAFDTAEKEADIAPLLDVEDMVKMKNPDWKCVFTYVQSIYRHLKDHENNKANPIEQ